MCCVIFIAMNRAEVRIPSSHPLATHTKRIRRARLELYKKIGGGEHKCNWCGIKVVWFTGKQNNKENAICADHLDGDSLNDDENNLVPSCRQCNANRKKDGSFNGRKKPRLCEKCGKEYIYNKTKQRFCSIQCIPKIKRGTKTKHGTRSRYNYGCRCMECKTENNRAWREWRASKK